MIHHIKRATRHLIFWSLIFFAVSLSAVRLLLVSVDYYKAELSVRVSELIGASVEIGHLRANMRGYSPELVLNDFKILSAVTNESPPIQFKEIRLGINLFDFLRTGDQFASSWVTLVGAKLTIKRKQDGNITIVGLKGDDEKPFWLLQGSKYEVLQSEISWLDELSQIKPVKLYGVNAAIINKSQDHQINALLKLPNSYGEELRLSMQLKGNIFEVSSINGSVFIEGKKIKPAEWISGHLSFPVTIPSGSADFKCWGELHQSQLDSIVGDVQIQQLTLTKPDKENILVQHLSTQFHWSQNDGQWRLQVPQMLIETDDNKWAPTVFSVFGDQAKDGKLHKLGVFINRLDLQKAVYLVDFFVPLSVDQRLLLKQSQLKGFLEQLSFFADLDEKHFAINGGFSHINVVPSQVRPGIENLTGHLKGTDQQGQVILASEAARLLTAGVFRQALDITRLNGSIDWQQTPDEYLLSSTMLTLNSPDLETDTRFKLRIPKAQGQPKFLDLQSGFSIADVSKANRYLPVNTMRKSVVEWLDRALVKGRVSNGGVLFYGNLNDFPFSKGQGVFEIPFQIDQLDLVYLSAWPRLNELGGDVLFLQDSLQVNLNKGFSKDVSINQAKIVIPTLGASEHILVQAKLNTGILQGLEFLQQTPLKSSADNLLNAIAPQGNTEVILDLKLPLADGAIAKVDGSAQLDNAKLKVKALDLWVTQLNGEVKFNEQGLYSNTITADALNKSIKVNIKNSDLLSTVNVTGHATARDLEKQFKLPGWRLVDGETDYQIKLKLPYDQTAPELLLESKLAGMGLDFPSTLAKTREQQRSLAMIFKLGFNDFLPIQINYDNQLKAVIKYDLKAFQIESADILLGLGDIPKNPSSASGINLFLNKERLDLQDWVSLGTSLATSEDAETTGTLSSVKEIKVHSEHGLWKKADLGLIDIELKPEANFWVGNIDSLMAKGKFKIPKVFNGADSIDLEMDELDLSAIKQLKSQGETGSTLTPEFMPLIQVNSQITRWHDVLLGKLKLETERIVDGVTFKRFDLVGDDQNLSLTGHWKNKGHYSDTHLEGTLNIPQAGQFFSKLGLSKDFSETNALVNFAGDWRGAPYQFSLRNLIGSLDIDFKNGRILGIEPGFGRVLGILAIAQWVKRFQLDFSDVFGDGLSFSNIKGRFDLLGGLASTRDLVVDAVPAKISITGNADLVRETVDYSVNVVPKSADAVPVAGTIMGKLTDFIGLALTGKDQQGFFFGSQYLVKGAWGNVQIIPLHENDGLLQKTWDGITGFPWLKQSSER